MREGDDPRLSLEVALLKVATPRRWTARGRHCCGGLSRSRLGWWGARPGVRPQRAGPALVDAKRAQAVDEPAIEQMEPAEAAPPVTPSQDDSAVEPADQPGATATATVEIERVVKLWPAIVDHVRGGSAMLSTLFDGARPLSIDQERSILRIGFPSSAKFNKRKAEAAANVERMSEAIEAIVGDRLRPVYELIEEEDASAETRAHSDLRIRRTGRGGDHRPDQDGVRRQRGGPGRLKGKRGGLMAQGPNLNQLLKQAQQMQAEMAKAQEQLANETVEASAGGGMVKVTMTGDMQLREIKISPEAIDPEESELLADMVTAAVSEAIRSAQELASNRMGGIAGMGGGLPGLGGLPGA